MALLPSATAWPATVTAGHGGPVTVTDLGPASEVTSTSVAERIGDRIYTATSGVSPVQVGAYDLETHVIEEKYSLPTGAGVWAMAHIGTDLYVGTYTPGHLYRIDTVTGGVRKVADFGHFIWAITASPDGRIFAGTYPDGGVHEYNPATGETTSYGSAVAGEQYVRSIAASETTVYAGVGASAHLIAIDRGTGEKVDVLPEEYANRTFVATLDLSGDTLAAGLSATGTLLLFDTDTMAKPTEVQVPAGDKYITAITVDETTGDTYLGARPSGTFALRGTTQFTYCPPPADAGTGCGETGQVGAQAQGVSWLEAQPVNGAGEPCGTPFRTATRSFTLDGELREQAILHAVNLNPSSLPAGCGTLRTSLVVRHTGGDPVLVEGGHSGAARTSATRGLAFQW